MIAPTPAIGSKLTSEETAYINQLSPLIDNYSTYMGYMRDTMSNADIASEEWKTKVAVLLGLFTIVNNDIRSLAPPGRFAASHQHLVEMTRYNDSALEYLRTGINNFDLDAIARSNDNISLATAAMNEALVTFESETATK